MRVYFLDWSGSLDTLGSFAEVREYLTALTTRGHLLGNISFSAPKEIMDLFHFKRVDKLPSSIAEHLSDTYTREGKRHRPRDRLYFQNGESLDPASVTEVVYCDDQLILSRHDEMQFEAKTGIKMRYLNPANLRKELEES